MCDNKKSVAWVKWLDICKSKEKGGLGVRDLESFNKALIGKWLWKYFRDNNSLWVKVIDSLLREGRVWWRDRVLSGTGERGRWFWEGLEKQLGDGGKHIFGMMFGWEISL